MPYFKKILILACFLFGILPASGERVASGREIRTVYTGQIFSIELKLPDKAKYADYYYTTLTPQLNTEYVQYLKREDTEDGRQVTYYFTAVKRGETPINIYRQKIGARANDGLEYSILVKVED